MQRKAPIPLNDNSKARALYLKSDRIGSRARLVPHIRDARRLISRHASKPYKHAIETPDYAFLEYQLCTYLVDDNPSPANRKFKIDGLAFVLEVSPLILYNDPHLPF